jgi:hypothetical protein
MRLFGFFCSFLLDNTSKVSIVFEFTKKKMLFSISPKNNLAKIELYNKKHKIK